jgi:hypothetical protein
MNRLVKTVSLAALATLSIGLAHADDEQVLDACIQQFIAANLSEYQGKISVHKETPFVSPWSALSRTEVVISVTGTHGSQLGSAVCHVDRSGKVVSLTPASGAVKLSKLAPIVLAGADSQ